MDYLLFKWIHVVSATILFGTGLGSAFYLFVANRSGDVKAICFISRWVVIADWIFTTPAFLVQLVTGYFLIEFLGFDYTEPWLLASFGLIALAGASWLLVLWIQIQMRDLAHHANSTSEVLSHNYWRLERCWTLLGCVGFSAFVAIFYLMVAKPDLY
ncbi:MAG: DUF2269 domain-containing protein [Sneathiella sp.]|nr:DUF2269 domain-containing protein [Sneathiella sp.]